MALVVSSMEPYAHMREKAVKKWKDFHSNCFNEEDDYMLLLENGKEALFLPGSYQEFFLLKRYHEELGKDYKIILYLCTRTDYEKFEAEEEDMEDVDEESLTSPSTDIPGRSRAGEMCTLDEFFNVDECYNAMSYAVESTPAKNVEIHIQVNVKTSKV